MIHCVYIMQLHWLLEIVVWHESPADIYHFPTHSAVKTKHVWNVSVNCLSPQMSNRLKKVWKPQLLKREFYSEILDHKFTIKVTPRTLDLVDAAFGFDFYILKVKDHDLSFVWQKSIFHMAFLWLWLSYFLSDIKGRPELQAGHGPKESHDAPPGAQRLRALPSRPCEEREGLQQIQSKWDVFKSTLWSLMCCYTLTETNPNVTQLWEQRLESNQKHNLSPVFTI